MKKIFLLFIAAIALSCSRSNVGKDMPIIDTIIGEWQSYEHYELDATASYIQIRELDDSFSATITDSQVKLYGWDEVIISTYEETEANSDVYVLSEAYAKNAYKIMLQLIDEHLVVTIGGSGMDWCDRYVCSKIIK